LLNEDDPEILVGISRVAAQVGETKNKTLAGRRLIETFERADWYLKDEIESVLIDLFGEAKTVIEEEIVRRSRLTEEKPEVDPVLSALLRVKRCIEEGAK
jgi:hypothetical protein